MAIPHFLTKIVFLTLLTEELPSLIQIQQFQGFAKIHFDGKIYLCFVKATYLLCDVNKCDVLLPLNNLV